MNIPEIISQNLINSFTFLLLVQYVGVSSSMSHYPGDKINKTNIENPSSSQFGHTESNSVGSSEKIEYIQNPNIPFDFTTNDYMRSSERFKPQLAFKLKHFNCTRRSL